MPKKISKNKIIYRIEEIKFNFSYKLVLETPKPDRFSLSLGGQEKIIWQEVRDAEID